MKRNTIYFAIVVIGLCISSYFFGRAGSGCTGQYIDTVYMEIEEIWITPYLDSIPTQMIMEDALHLNYINYKDDPRRGNVELFEREDMEYLPYFFLTFSCSTTIPSDVERKIHDYIDMCASMYNDSTLFNLGKEAVISYNKRKARRPDAWLIEYPDSFDKINNIVPTKIDTLRVNVISHNDRKALGQLEKYYKGIGYDLGIAIYYKALLCRDGNGDLAERLYRVLKPYFDERPELENAAREALIRAAMCDKDKRAQQLCDSLGYTFCDYKVRIP